MSTATTPNGLFLKPEVNSAVDEDLWGGILNNNWDTQDSLTTTRTSDLDFGGNVLSDVEIQDASETAFNKGNVSGAVVLDYLDGHYQYMTLTGNVTSLTISNLPASGKVGFMTLEMNQDGSGSRTLTLDPLVYLTVANLSVTLTTAASSKDKLRLETRNGGTTIDVFTNLDIR